MTGPVVSISDYARGGAIVGDTKDQINAFLERCLTIRKVVGPGVHPRAIGRLVEVWPEAVVEVKHSPAAMSPRFTVVDVVKSPDHRKTEGHVSRAATCSREDQFVKATGIVVAFDRCLREAVRRAEPERVSAGQRPARYKARSGPLGTAARS